MVKIIKVLLLLSSVVITAYSSELITFKKLTELASNDLGKNIYLDKDLPKYSVEFNLVDYQKKGQVYEFYKIVLFENDLLLQYNNSGDFYFIKEKKKELVAKEPLPIHETKKLHYYTYKIKHITNEDVVNAMTIFPNVKFKYLKQSDIIAYSATLSDHNQVKKILRKADNKVLHKTVKLTMFSINKNRLKEVGSDLSKFQLDVDLTLGGIVDNLVTENTTVFNLTNTAYVSLALRAMEAYSVANISQSPTVRLTNGVKSTVTSVMNVPYLKTTSTVDAQTNSVTEQYDYKDIGLQINILPKIKNDWVYLNLNLISEELISLDDDKPITQKITYKNSVKLTKGKPILLTGIKKVSKHFEKSGIPLLQAFPLIGQLFRKKSVRNEEQNINILIEVI